MINLFWRIIAKVLARPAIADWLIARAKLTPVPAHHVRRRHRDVH